MALKIRPLLEIGSLSNFGNLHLIGEQSLQIEKGCASVYWNEEDNQRSGVRTGFTEDIFVLPEWRGHGIAYALVADGLAYLKGHGLTEAHLMVHALNESALGLYRSMGFQVCAESRFYALHL